MGGEIGAESVEGEGSFFWIRLPLIEGSPKALPPVQINSEDSPCLNVLVVEDNAINRIVLREMLQAAGHTVTEASDGAEGVKRAQDTAFDAILMDISMPVMDGLEATRRIRKDQGASQNSKIIAVTAHVLPEEIEEFHRTGMTDVISKPVERDKMLKALAPCASAIQGTTGPVGMAIPPLFDLRRIADLKLELGPAAAEALVRRARTETDAMIERLNNGGSKLHPDEILHDLHRTAGTAAAMGWTRLHHTLGVLEAAAKRGENDGVRSRLGELKTIWSDMADQLP
jgi:CheY-like chemotaxis protein